MVSHGLSELLGAENTEWREKATNKSLDSFKAELHQLDILAWSDDKSKKTG